MEGFNVAAGPTNPKPSSSSSSSHTAQANSLMELFNSLASMEGFNTSVHGITPSGVSNHQHQQAQMLMTFNDEIGRSIGQSMPSYDPLAHFFASSHGCHGMIDTPAQPEITLNSPPSASRIGFTLDQYPKQNYGGKKRKRMNEKEMEKPREVVHVRAKRGQATDSHSLAERLRREKINEKLRCLQDLVPGCYKTMGMAVMLDVIINYVRSLQNQIDFLSMKLSAASLFYDFNSSEAEAIETMQGNTGYEAQVMEKVVGESYGGIPHFQTSWPL